MTDETKYDILSDTALPIEDRIIAHQLASGGGVRERPTVYRVRRETFDAFVLRQNARVQGDCPAWVAAHTAQGVVRVEMTTDERLPDGVLEVAAAAQQQPPSLAGRVSEQLLEGAIKACLLHKWSDAVQLVRAFLDLRAAVIEDARFPA